MTNAAPERWRELNDGYLAAAVAWVRSLLSQRIVSARTTTDGLAPSQHGILAIPSGHLHVEGGGHPASFAAQEVDEHRDSAASEVMVRSLETEVAETGSVSTIQRMASLFGLSEFEQRIVLLCLAFELDTRVAWMCGQIQDQPHRAFPTFGLALSLFREAEWIAIPPERPLRRFRLIEFRHPAGTPLVAAELRLEETVLHYLRGVTSIDERLTSLVAPLALQHGPLSEAQQETSARLAQLLVYDGGPPVVVQLLGADLAGKLRIARAAAVEQGLAVFRTSVEALPSSTADLDEFARVWRRDAALFRLALIADAHDLNSSSEPAKAAALARLAARLGTPLLVVTPEPLPLAGVDDRCVEILGPSPRQQFASWCHLLPKRLPRRESVAGELSRQFSFDRDKMRAFVRETAHDERGRSAGGFRDVLWQKCREHTRPRVAGLAQRVETKASWDDLVLGVDCQGLLEQIRGQVRARWRVYDDWGMADRMSRGLGISAVFTGESGTGKTMAAEILANDLGLDLYRVDLSSVVNKYIGETEKHLRRLFDAFESGGAILFFDECDALFGKRSEVKDSHDRYANIEVNYLLQRLESYRGLAILATNNRGALDAAFLRRLRFVVTFAMPTIAERKRIWQRLLPPLRLEERVATPPVGLLDYDRLAELNFSGGNIHNVAVNSAFRAAQRTGASSIAMQDVLAAARDEYVKLERPVNESDFAYSDPSTEEATA